MALGQGHTSVSSAAPSTVTSCVTPVHALANATVGATMASATPAVGIPQDLPIANITAWCGQMGQALAAIDYPDQKLHDGYFLSTEYSTNLINLAFPYENPNVTMFLTVQLVNSNGNDVPAPYTMSIKDCNTAFLTILNGCPPKKAPATGPFLKYGGSYNLTEKTSYGWTGVEYSMVLAANPDS